VRYNCDDESHRDNADFEALVEMMRAPPLQAVLRIRDDILRDSQLI